MRKGYPARTPSIYLFSVGLGKCVAGKRESNDAWATTELFVSPGQRGIGRVGRVSIGGTRGLRYTARSGGNAAAGSPRMTVL